MTDPANPFAAWMTHMQDMAKTMNPALENFTPQGFEKLWPTMPADMMEQFAGKGVSPEGLDAKTKMLLTLAALTMLGAQAEAQIRMTVRQAAAQGATRQEIAEAIGLMGMFAGLPAMNKAMQLADDALGDDA
ncbi:4-carboxymuconolactone decarboxylase [Jannaschia seosinensis]|uniref:4-carboxymuconolactone decarboxylase n=1 Tax=Jannaschia seosinensis TaxID=313367 RepID=A0A0M7B7A5_9RHOB|nr:carboxymuconolactone decarboxylase family protein [Jannaschia seosinensis]CUH32342.1 4-carboxymuconolactone decarboxylase [Jannaschia seosinensis]